MRWVVVVLLAVHGLIHLMGFAKAFGYAELPQLTQPISREVGVLWLGAGVLVVASAVMLARRRPAASGSWAASRCSSRRRSSCRRGETHGRARPRTRSCSSWSRTAGSPKGRGASVRSSTRDVDGGAVARPIERPW